MVVTNKTNTMLSMDFQKIKVTARQQLVGRLESLYQSLMLYMTEVFVPDSVIKRVCEERLMERKWEVILLRAR
jgi:hypothetical protein